LESGEPREVHHFACLAGYGAEAINPYLAFETLVAMKHELPQKLDDKEIIKRYIKSIDKGLLKVMSKMGISTYQSYCGAQIFDAVGLKSDFVAKYFTGTATRIEGVGLADIAEEAVRRHRDAFSDAPIYRAMPFGSISREAHTTLAIAMNRIGGKSNTGEGGEEAERFKPLPNGDSMRSAIKQVASGRFGVTAEYLVNSDMMQIKIAQGAKPGEGGQLPGHKVDKIIAKVRHSTPG